MQADNMNMTQEKVYMTKRAIPTRAHTMPNAVQVRLDDADFEVITRMAVEEERAIGTVVRRLMREGLAARAQAAAQPKPPVVHAYGAQRHNGGAAE